MKNKRIKIPGMPSGFFGQALEFETREDHKYVRIEIDRNGFLVAIFVDPKDLLHVFRELFPEESEDV